MKKIMIIGAVVVVVVVLVWYDHAKSDRIGPDPAGNAG
jgi:hypothetical protein